jgi:hypothetical protein
MGLTNHFQLSIVMQFGSLSLLEPSGPVQALPFSEGIADFLFSNMCEPFLGLIQLHIKWIPGEPSSGGSGRVLELTANLKIVLRLTMHGALLILPPAP